MSFVDWVTALALLAVALGGGYGAALSVLTRRVEVSPYVVEGRGALALGLVYLAGGAAALIALVLMLGQRL